MKCIKLENQTRETIRIAIFKKPFKQPSLNLWAWQILNIPAAGITSVEIPQTTEVFVNYPGPKDSRTDPYAGRQTNKISVDGSTARFILTSKTTIEGNDTVVHMERVSEGLAPEIHIENQAQIGVWGHMTQSGKDLYAPEIIVPGGTLMETITENLTLAVVGEFVTEENRVLKAEIESAPTQILTGQIAVVTGSKWDGYAMAVSQGTVER